MVSRVQRTVITDLSRVKNLIFRIFEKTRTDRLWKLRTSLSQERPSRDITPTQLKTRRWKTLLMIQTKSSQSCYGEYRILLQKWLCFLTDSFNFELFLSKMDVIYVNLSKITDKYEWLLKKSSKITKNKFNTRKTKL